MRKILAAAAIAALAVSGGAVNAKQTTAEKGEARLQKMLEGRTPGEPVSCITTQRSDGLEVIDETAIVYDGGGTIYVARPRDPKSLGPFDILLIDRHGSQLCTSDSLRTIDRSSGMTTGVVFLDKFVPYTKTKTGN